MQQIGYGANFDPAFGVRLGLRREACFAHARFRLRQPALDVISGVLDLLAQRRNDFAPRVRNTRIGRGAVVLYRGVESGQRMIGNQREHVVLNVVVHVPVEIAVDQIHVYRPAVETVVEHILCQAGMLRHAVDGHEPSAEYICEPDEHQRENAALINRKSDDGGVDEEIDARPEIDLGELRLGNEGFFRGGHAADAVHEHGLEIFRVSANAKKGEDDCFPTWRARHGDFRIAADDDGVAVMTVVAPAPDCGLAHDHE